MIASRTVRMCGWAVCGWALAGCAAPKVDFASIQRPTRANELNAYNVFVGQWDWEAEMLNAASDADRKWTGAAEWKWTLDERCLHGVLSAKSARTDFEAAGVWSRHPKTGKYIWWMFNNWGYPQEGTADYDAASRTWTMDYTSVGLDGTPSHGRYTMKVLDDKTLEWYSIEWADALHTIKKMEMKGTYKRRAAAGA